MGHLFVIPLPLIQLVIIGFVAVTGRPGYMIYCRGAAAPPEAKGLAQHLVVDRVEREGDYGDCLNNTGRFHSLLGYLLMMSFRLSIIEGELLSLAACFIRSII
jgi:hypothetical protein